MVFVWEMNDHSIIYLINSRRWFLVVNGVNDVIDFIKLERSIENFARGWLQIVEKRRV